MKHTVYLSLGGNEGQALACLQKALHLLSTLPKVEAFKASHFYCTSPINVETPLWFVNAACSFQTTLTPNEIFHHIRTIEIQLGKIPKPKNVSRPIDIDFLFYGNQMHHEKDLEIPHPRWKERLFVLIPLSDLTQIIHLKEKDQLHTFILEDLIKPLVSQSSQTIYLLEKNPDIQ